MITIHKLTTPISHVARLKEIEQTLAHHGKQLGPFQGAYPRRAIKQLLNHLKRRRPQLTISGFQKLTQPKTK